ncbi:MAG TPA: FprA family A-type flavoprotein, partial [candidate division Zixibacteria bacterium]|nr:FprA family A-type flavoprotein [candidate division Zixibacteria bacterium]
MQPPQISDNVWWVGVRDRDLRIFDIIMATQHGTTYNAYLVKGTERVALIDTVKAAFTEEYFANIAAVVPLDRVNLLVVNHTEPDHSGAMHALLDRLPNLEIVCATAALPFVKNVLNREAKITPVKDNSEIDLGGKRLIFKLTPYMHWPDTMMEFLAEDGILFSCDGFAAHIAFDDLWADQSAVDFDSEMHYYYDAIMRPFAPYIRKNLPKLADFAIRMIAPSHGPLIRRDVAAHLDKYRRWSADKTEGKNQVAIVYVSSYGNTARIAGAVEANLRG